MGRRSRWRGRGICAHCREERELDGDHVPPECLFPGVPPSELIEVPSCDACNGGSSDDDENFKLHVLLHIRAYGHPRARAPYESALRGLAKPRKRPYLNNLVRRFRHMNFVTPSGAFIGRLPTLDVSWDRLETVARRITTGIFFRETGRPLARGYSAAAAYAERLIDARAPEPLKDYASVLSQAAKVIGSGAFSYRFVRAEDDPDGTMTWMTFFDAVHFVGFTVKEAHMGLGGNLFPPPAN